MRTSIPLALLVVVVGLIGCGGPSSSEGPDSTGLTAAVPNAPPPKKLVIEDIKEGTGKPVKTGDEVTVQWAGFYYKNGHEFYATAKDHHPFTFLTGAGRVIRGWDRGMVGMKVGGRRQLTIPPALAYGDTGTTSVPPDETLIYVVDLLAIE